MSSRWDQLHGLDYVFCCWQVLPVQGRRRERERERRRKNREERERERKRENKEGNERSRNRKRELERSIKCNNIMSNNINIKLE